MSVSDSLPSEPPEGKVAFPSFDFQTDRSRTALLLVDLQNMFAHPDYGVGRHLSGSARDSFFERLSGAVIPNASRLLESFRARGQRVVFLALGPESEGADECPAPMRARWRARQALSPEESFRRGSRSHAIVDALRPAPGELVINHLAPGGFNATALDQVLRSFGIESVVVAGLHTDEAVDSTARNAADLGYWCTIAADACAALEPAAHLGTLAAFATLFGKIETTAALVSESGGRRGGEDGPNGQPAIRVPDGSGLERNAWAHPHVVPDFDPEATALLIVDLQNWLAYPSVAPPRRDDYFLSRLDNVVVPNARRLLTSFRARGLPLVYLTIGPETVGARELSPLTRIKWQQRRALSPSGATFVRGTPENQVVQPLKPLDDELVINKTTASAFVSSNIDFVLRNMGVRHVVIIGAVTNGCVENTARDASDHGYWCTVVDDACATLDETAHEVALRALARSFGRVLSTGEALARLERALAGARSGRA